MKKLSWVQQLQANANGTLHALYKAGKALSFQNNVGIKLRKDIQWGRTTLDQITDEHQRTAHDFLPSQLQGSQIRFYKLVDKLTEKQQNKVKNMKDVNATDALHLIYKLRKSKTVCIPMNYSDEDEADGMSGEVLG